MRPYCDLIVCRTKDLSPLNSTKVYILYPFKFEPMTSYDEANVLNHKKVDNLLQYSNIRTHGHPKVEACTKKKSIDRPEV